jgi:hypothetical protein
VNQIGDGLKKKLGFLAILAILISSLVASPLVAEAAPKRQSASVFLSGLPVVGESIFAEIEGLKDGSRITYSWTVNGTKFGSGELLEISDESWTGATLKVSITAKKSGYKDFKFTSPGIVVGAISKIRKGSISGELFAYEGSQLTAECGDYMPKIGFGSSESACAIQWKADGSDIEGQIDPTFDLTSDYVGARISAVVTISAEGMEPKTDLLTTSGVIRGKLTISEEPTFNSDNIVGYTLSVESYPIYSGDPDSVAVQWFRSGKKISGATRSSYRLSSSDWHKRITVSMTARKSSYAPTTNTWLVASSVYKLLTKKGPAYTGYSAWDSCDYANSESADCWRNTTNPAWAVAYNEAYYNDDFTMMSLSVSAPVSAESILSWRTIVTGTTSIDLLLEPASDEGIVNADYDNAAFFSAGTGTWTSKWSTIPATSDGMLHLAIYGNDEGGYIVKTVKIEVRYLG